MSLQADAHCSFIPKDVEIELSSNGEDVGPSPPKKHKQDNTVTDCKTIDNLLVKMICVDLQPIAILTNEGFQNLIKYLHPLYSMPTTKVFTTCLLSEHYDKAKTELMDILQLMDHVAVTVFMWKSECESKYELYCDKKPDQEEMITLTIHFIHGMKFHSRTLSTKELRGSPTYQDIGNVIKEILEEQWKILDKVVCIVTNYQTILVQAVKEHLKISHAFCVAHALSRVINGSMVKFKILKKKYVGKNNRLFDWYNIMHYRHSLTESKEKDQRELRECLSILEPFEELLDILSNGSDQCPISCIIPLLSSVQLSLQKYSPTSELAKCFRNELVSDIKIHHQYGYCDAEKLASKATFLDPRFKKVAFENESCVDLVQEAVLKELKNDVLCDQDKVFPQTSNISLDVNEEKSSNLWSHFDRKVLHMLSNATPFSPVLFEMKQYVNLSYLKRSDNPYRFWEDTKSHYRNLYKIAHKYSCIPATSIPPEHIISSKYMNLISRLEPENADQILFLHSYYSEHKK